MCIRDRFQTAYSEQAQRPELAFLPRWQTCELDLAAAYAQRMSEVEMCIRDRYCRDAARRVQIRHVGGACRCQMAQVGGLGADLVLSLIHI